MKLSVHIAAPEGMTAQSTRILIKNYDGGAYNSTLCYSQCGACNAGESLKYMGVFDFFPLYFDEYGRERKDLVGFYSAPQKYTGANSITNATKVIENLNFIHWKTNPPYIHIQFANGGIIGAGSKIVMEVC